MEPAISLHGAAWMRARSLDMLAADMLALDTLELRQQLTERLASVSGQKA